MIDKRTIIISAVLAIPLIVGASCNEAPQPTKQPTPHLTAKKKAPTGCAGKITLRRYNPDSNDFTIKYKSTDCSGTNEETITFEQDLNARCDEGDFFPQCLKWYETHAPGMRTPTENS